MTIHDTFCLRLAAFLIGCICWGIGLVGTIGGNEYV